MAANKTIEQNVFEQAGGGQNSTGILHTPLFTMRTCKGYYKAGSKVEPVYHFRVIFPVQAR